MQFFSKMYRVSQVCLMGVSLSTYLGRLPKWVSMLSGVIYAPKMQAHRTSGNDGSAWPTPNAQDSHSGRVAHIKGHQLHLTHAVHMWPTPNARDSKGKTGATFNTINLPDQVDGKLNPEFCEILMGFPVGWTSLDFPPVPVSHSTPMSRHVQRLARQRRTHVSKPWEMRSFPKLHTRSFKRYTNG